MEQTIQPKVAHRLGAYLIEKRTVYQRTDDILLRSLISLRLRPNAGLRCSGLVNKCCLNQRQDCAAFKAGFLAQGIQSAAPTAPAYPLTKRALPYELSFYEIQMRVSLNIMALVALQVPFEVLHGLARSDGGAASTTQSVI